MMGEQKSQSKVKMLRERKEHDVDWLIICHISNLYLESYIKNTVSIVKSENTHQC